MVLADIINNGLNNPDCAFFVGMYAGMGRTTSLIITLAVSYFIFKAVDKLVYEPIMAKLKLFYNKIFKKKEVIK